MVLCLLAGDNKLCYTPWTKKELNDKQWRSRPLLKIIFKAPEDLLQCYYNFILWHCLVTHNNTRKEWIFLLLWGIVVWTEDEEEPNSPKRSFSNSLELMMTTESSLCEWNNRQRIVSQERFQGWMDTSCNYYYISDRFFVSPVPGFFLPLSLRSRPPKGL